MKAKNTRFEDAQIFNLLEEFVYIIDPHTHELLFVNDTIRKAFHLRRELPLTKCYTAFCRRTMPCAFCPSADTKAAAHWEIHNPILQRFFQLKSRPIIFRGHTARLVIAFDITKQEKEKHTLQNTLQADRVLKKAVYTLYATKNLSRALDKILKEFALFLGADRAYIFELQKGSFRAEHIWASPAISSAEPLLQEASLPLLGHWKPALAHHKCFYLPNLTKAPANWQTEYTQLQQQGIHSLLLAPLENQNTLSGFIAFENPQEEKSRYIQPMLLSLSYFISSARLAAQHTAMLEQMSYQDTMTGVGNRNAFIRDTRLLENTLVRHAVGVIFCDLNHLKELNDTYGHESGDSAIISLARFMKSFFSPQEIYRTSGDEFLILTIDMPEKLFFQHVKAIQQVLRHNRQLSVSIGTVWDAAPQSIGQLVNRADHNMYRVKKRMHKKDQQAKK